MFRPQSKNTSSKRADRIKLDILDFSQYLSVLDSREFNAKGISIPYPADYIHNFELEWPSSLPTSLIILEFLARLDTEEVF